MFMNFRRIRKCQCVQLTALCFTISLMMVYWKPLDNNVMSHVRSYSYRYLVNSYDFLNKSFTVSREEAEGFGNHRYLMNHKEKCREKDVLLLLLVKTSPENGERRMAIRSTWGNETYMRQELGVNIRVVFVLGVHPQESKQAQVQRDLAWENQHYSDLVQQDFVDTFHNLTVKLLMQLHWAHTYCRHANFVMSTDDDVFIHMPNLVRYLQSVAQRQVRNFWIGRVYRGAPPIRRKDSKYYVPYEMYRWSSYPDYTAGAGYVVSDDVAAKVYEVSLTLNATLYIDDVFMGICANIMGISPRDHAYFSGDGKAPYHPCIYDKMMTSHGHVKDIHHLWKSSTGPQVHRTSSGLLSKLYCMAIRVTLLCKPYNFNTYPCKAAFL